MSFKSASLTCQDCCEQQPRPGNHLIDPDSRTQSTTVALRYDDARIVAAWRALAGSAAYPYSRECRDSLKAMLGSSAMRTRLGGGGFSRYVCLGGGGAPEKDRILLASMARARACQKRPRLVLIDHHAAMLDVSRESLPRSAARIAEVEFACRDFMDLRCDAQLSRAKGATMWLLSGATFGNIDEEMFSEAVGTVASAGDWLVLGVDLRDNRDPSGQRHRLIAAYGSPEGRRLFALAAGRNPEKDSDAIRVDVVEAYKDCLSSVPGSLSLIAGWDGCRPIRSNRYDRNFLRHWWQLRGWREIAAVAGPAGGTYRQVILERI